MNTKNVNPFGAQNICSLLVDNGLLKPAHAREILKKKDLLLKRINRKVASEATPEHENNRKNIIDVIASLNLSRADNPNLPLDEEIIYQTLASQWKFPFERIDPLKLELNTVTTTIPRSFALNHLVLPIRLQDCKLTIATPDPFNEEVFDDIQRACNLEIEVVVSPKNTILKLIHEFFGFKKSIAAAKDQFSGPSVDLGNLEQYVRLKAVEGLPSNDQHIVNAVNHLFIYAFDQKASDIHIEPKREHSLVRMRIDGVLHTVYKLPKAVHSAIVSRIKNLSRMDMAEKRRPQDGRIKTDKGDVEAEIRVSTIPVAFGEKIVMRIMDPDILFTDLERLGFDDRDLDIYRQMAAMPHGIILVCGPTGSGKSTTLYSTLNTISTPEVNITTVEEPIEMVHEDFNQIAVQPQLGITFGSVLRHILRQDPDIIMIGEMRDLETAENAIQAALTGHLVFSTLHTNDAPSSIIRLLDLGVPHFLLQSTLVGIMAQRLVRKVCVYCKEEFAIDTRELSELGLMLDIQGSLTLCRGKGCPKCRNTGYMGRTGIHEILRYSDSIRAMTTANADVNAIRSQARKEGMRTLRESAIKKLLEGITTYQEVLRVTWEQD